MRRLLVLVSIAFVGFGTSGLSPSIACAQGPPPGAVWYKQSAPDRSEADANLWTQFRKVHKRNFEAALRSGTVSPAQKAELERAAKVYADRMKGTADDRKNLPAIGDELLKRIDTFSTPASRDVILPALSAEVAKLFNHEAIVVRINAAVLLGRMNIEPAKIGAGNQPAVGFWQSSIPLMGTIDDPNQAVAVKVRAALSLARQLRDSEIPIRERSDVMERLARVIRETADPMNWPQNPNARAFYWSYMLSLTEAMRSIEIPRTLTLKPVPAEVLLELVLDQQQHWLVRSTAYRGLSELELTDDNTFDLTVIANLGAWLAEQAANDYAKNAMASHWRRTFGNIYFAFRPPRREQAEQGFGFETMSGDAKFRRHEATVAAAFAAIEPIYSTLIAANPFGPPPRLPNAAVTALATYVADNPVDGAEVHPRIPAIRIAQPAAPAAAPADAAATGASGE